MKSPVEFLRTRKLAASIVAAGFAGSATLFGIGIGMAETNTTPPTHSSTVADLALAKYPLLLEAPDTTEMTTAGLCANLVALSKAPTTEEIEDRAASSSSVETSSMSSDWPYTTIIENVSGTIEAAYTNTYDPTNCHNYFVVYEESGKLRHPNLHMPHHMASLSEVRSFGALLLGQPVNHKLAIAQWQPGVIYELRGQGK